MAEIFTAVDEAPALDVAADVELAGAVALLVAELLGELELLEPELEPTPPPVGQNPRRMLYARRIPFTSIMGGRRGAGTRPGLRKRYRATLDPVTQLVSSVAPNETPVSVGDRLRGLGAGSTKARPSFYEVKG